MPRNMRSAIAVSCCRVMYKTAASLFYTTHDKRTKDSTRHTWCMSKPIFIPLPGAAFAKQRLPVKKPLAALGAQHDATPANLIAYAVPYDGPGLEALPVHKGKHAHGINKCPEPAPQGRRLGEQAAPQMQGADHSRQPEYPQQHARAAART